jgi:hypothetical protein
MMPCIKPRLLASILAEDRLASFDDNNGATGKMFKVAGRARTKSILEAGKLGLQWGSEAPFINRPRQSN